MVFTKRVSVFFARGEGYFGLYGLIRVSDWYVVRVLFFFFLDSCFFVFCFHPNL